MLPFFNLLDVSGSKVVDFIILDLDHIVESFDLSTHYDDLALDIRVLRLEESQSVDLLVQEGDFVLVLSASGLVDANLRVFGSGLIQLRLELIDSLLEAIIFLSVDSNRFLEFANLDFVLGGLREGDSHILVLLLLFSVEKLESIKVGAELLDLEFVLSDSGIRVSVSDSEFVELSELEGIAALDSVLFGDEDGDSLFLFLDDSLEVSGLRVLSSEVVQLSTLLLVCSIGSFDFLIEEEDSVIVLLDDEGSGGFSEFLEFVSFLGVGLLEPFDLSAEKCDFSLVVLDHEHLVFLLRDSDSELFDLSGLAGDDLGESLVFLGEGVDFVDSDFDLLVLGSQLVSLFSLEPEGIVEVSDFFDESFDIFLTLLLGIGDSAFVVSDSGLVLLDSEVVVLVLGVLGLVAVELGAEVDDFFFGVSEPALVVEVLGLEVLELDVPVFGLPLLLFEEFDELLVVGLEDTDLADSDVLFGEFSDADLEAGVSGTEVFEFVVLEFEVPSESVVFLFVGADFFESSLVLVDLFQESGVIGLGSLVVVYENLVLGSVAVVVSVFDLDVIVSSLPLFDLSSVEFFILEGEFVEFVEFGSEDIDFSLVVIGQVDLLSELGVEFVLVSLVDFDFFFLAPDNLVDGFDFVEKSLDFGF